MKLAELNAILMLLVGCLILIIHKYNKQVRLSYILLGMARKPINANALRCALRTWF